MSTSRRALALLAVCGLSPSLAAPEERARVVFRVHPLASQQQLLDRSSRGPGLVGLGQPRPPSASLRAWSRLRQQWEERWQPAPDAPVPLPLGLDMVLPPAPGQDPAEAFDLAFLEARTATEAAAKLGLSAGDAAALERLIDAQAVRVAAGLEAAGRFAPLIERLEGLAKRVDLEGFLARAARFYGVEDRLPPTIHVELLWSPDSDGFLAATQVGSHMVLPVPQGWGRTERDAAALLTTVVHELGHYFVSLLPGEVRARVARAIVEGEGVLNAGRPNVFDEALQTALGTLIFARDRLPDSFDPREPLYGEDRGETYPDAIDVLARELEAPLRAHLDTPGAFQAAFLTEGLAAQARRYPRRPLHFSRSCLVLAPRRTAATAFQRAFPDGDQLAREELGLDDFAPRSQELAGATRWLLLEPQDLQRRPGLLAELGTAWAAPLAAGLTETTLAQVQAARRGPGLGYDVVVVARDAAGLRRALVALRTARSLPESEPLSVR